MLIKDSKKWFVLYTKPRYEIKVLKNLLAIEIETYTPTRIEVRKWSDRNKKNTKIGYRLKI